MATIASDLHNQPVQTRLMLWLLLLTPLWSFSPDATAQGLYHINFKGVCTTLDASGQVVTQPVNNSTLTRDWAARVGVTNVKSLALIFHPNSGEHGHTIDLVNKNDGSLVNGVFLLYFPESAANSSGTSARRFAYVFTVQQNLSIGTVIMNERTSIKNGRTNHFLVDADMEWYQFPEGTNGLRIYTGKFKTGKPLKVP